MSSSIMRSQGRGGNSGLLPPVAGGARNNGKRQISWNVPDRSVADGVLEKPPKIRVFRNGDVFFQGRNIIIRNPQKGLDKLLDELAPICSEPVSRLYSATTGKRVTKIEELEDGKDYVAAKKEKFKRVMYQGISDARTREIEYKKEKGIVEKKPLRLPSIGTKQYADIKSRIHESIEGQKALTIHIIKNGDERNEHHTFVVNNRNTHNYGQLTERVSVMMNLENPCRALYTIMGVPIEHLEELEDNVTYVAVGRIPFMQVGYKPIQIDRSLRKKKMRALKKQQVGAAVKKKDLQLLRQKVELITILNRVNARTDVAEHERGTKFIGKTSKQSRALAFAANRKICPYEVRIFTGDKAGAGTDAKVYITIYGDLGDSGKRLLNEDDRNFKAGRKDVFTLEAPRVGEMLRIRLEHDNSGESDDSSAWYVEHVEITDVSTGGTSTSGDTSGAVKKYFWFNTWCKIPPKFEVDVEDNGDLPARVASLETRATFCMDAKSADAEAKAEATRILNELLAPKIKLFTILEQRLLAICADKMEYRRLWKHLEAESTSSSYVPLHEFWGMLSNNYAQLYSMSARMRAYNFTVGADNDNRVGKHTFRALLLNTFYFCWTYAVFDLDDDGLSDEVLSLNNFKTRVPFLGVEMDEEALDEEYKLLEEEADNKTGGGVTIDIVCAWLARLKVPLDVKREAEAASAKLRDKEERKRRRREEKRRQRQEAKAAIAGGSDGSSPSGDADQDSEDDMDSPTPTSSLALPQRRESFTFVLPQPSVQSSPLPDAFQTTDEYGNFDENDETDDAGPAHLEVEQEEERKEENEPQVEHEQEEEHLQESKQVIDANDNNNNERSIDVTGSTTGTTDDENPEDDQDGIFETTRFPDEEDTREPEEIENHDDEEMKEIENHDDEGMKGSGFDNDGDQGQENPLPPPISPAPSITVANSQASDQEDGEQEEEAEEEQQLEQQEGRWKDLTEDDFNELEVLVRDLALDKTKTQTLWEALDGQGTLEAVHQQLKLLDPRFDDMTSLQRAYRAAVDSELSEPVVEPGELLPLVVCSYYFTRLLKSFPEFRSDPESRMGFIQMVSVCEEEDFVMDSSELKEHFMQMSSFQDESDTVMFDEFVIWYVAQCCPEALEGDDFNAS